MNKNTAIAIVLIGLILIGFSWYNSKTYREQERERFVRDSVALAEFEKARAENPELFVPDSISRPATAINIEPVQSGAITYKDSMLSVASAMEEEITTLENDLIQISLSNIGAQPKSVVVKNYYTYDSLALMIIKDGGSNLSLDLYANEQLSTANFGFTKNYSSGNSVSYRLYIDQTSYIEYNYILPEDSYMLDLNIRMVGMNSRIPRNVTMLDLSWTLDVPRQEKGYQNEKNYSTISYMFPNSGSAENLGRRRDSGSEQIRTKVNWFSFQQQFFSAILVAKDNFGGGDLGFTMYPETDPSGNLMRCTANMLVPYSAGQDVSIPLELYFGPNRYKTLKSYDKGFEQLVPLGWSIIGWVNRYIVINVFNLLNKHTSNYGLIILLLTLLIKLIISPLTLKSYMSSAKMRVLKPEIDKINTKYPNQSDAMKKQQETMALYKKCGVSPFGGCLPMLLQFPVLIALFYFFPVSFELRQESFLWAEDLSAYDSILNLPFKIPLYGDHVSLFALLMATSMFFYSRMNADQMNAGPQMAGMKVMMQWFMPIMMLVICNNFSSGLSYYYMLSNVLTMLQTWVIRKYFVDEAKILAKLNERSAAPPKKKSKFQERLEAAYKEQQRQQQQQKKKR